MEPYFGFNSVAELGFEMESWLFDGNLSVLFNTEEELTVVKHGRRLSEMRGVLVLWEYPRQGLYESYVGFGDADGMEHRGQPKDSRALDVAWRVPVGFLQRFFRDDFGQDTSSAYLHPKRREGYCFRIVSNRKTVGVGDEEESEGVDSDEGECESVGSESVDSDEEEGEGSEYDINWPVISSTAEQKYIPPGYARDEKTGDILLVDGQTACMEVVKRRLQRDAVSTAERSWIYPCQQGGEYDGLSEDQIKRRNTIYQFGEELTDFLPGGKNADMKVENIMRQCWTKGLLRLPPPYLFDSRSRAGAVEYLKSVQEDKVKMDQLVVAIAENNFQLREDRMRPMKRGMDAGSTTAVAGQDSEMRDGNVSNGEDEQDARTPPRRFAPGFGPSPGRRPTPVSLDEWNVDHRHPQAFLEAIAARNGEPVFPHLSATGSQPQSTVSMSDDRDGLGVVREGRVERSRTTTGRRNVGRERIRSGNRIGLARRSTSIEGGDGDESGDYEDGMDTM